MRSHHNLKWNFSAPVEFSGTVATRVAQPGDFVFSRPADTDTNRYRGMSKRLFDLIVCMVLLPIIAPFIALIYALVRLDGGPGFFKHTRVGRGGKVFECWKIRTMVTDAQNQLETLLAHDPNARAEWNRDHKLRDDPRITKIGAFLRKSSLDELPQILNVLRGEMSLIGPRPITAEELERYGARKWAYLALRPGVTGLWQVSGRNDLSYNERVDLDVSYFKRLSLGTDVAILFRTVGAVLSKTGC